jgi:hypothetical protein
MKIGASLFLALRDCASYSTGTYIWKPKSMERLAALGLVECVGMARFAPPGTVAYAITDAGRALIKDAEAA